MRLIWMLVTWWNSQTVGTRLFTMRNGRRIGEDSDGNVYYQNADGSRRWVIYNGEIEASRIPADWHGWLHHTFHEPPTVKPFAKQSWQAEHRRNMTGTERAYVPPGSLRSDTPKAVKDYSPWDPDSAGGEGP
ncbi:MAG: NADH:ubiquinone oxidoreductase subunit NDUFA12 [Rhodobacteraceae bacterium]|nr:NADH:ubiquinone oxidoreductase subunit NDUFA12 [Paracoccaceae bacterium]